MALDDPAGRMAGHAVVRGVGLALLLAPALGGVAQERTPPASGQGTYMPVGRMNDPFVFCSEGMPMHGWVALNPVAGTWTPISQYVNYQWIPTYVAICPHSMGQGMWQGPGTGSTVPFVH